MLSHNEEPCTPVDIPTEGGGERSKRHTPDQQALKEIVEEMTNNAKTPLSRVDTETVLDWAEEVGYMDAGDDVRDRQRQLHARLVDSQDRSPELRLFSPGPRRLLAVLLGHGGGLLSLGFFESVSTPDSG